MKNISKQYQDLLEGKMSRDNFVRNCRQQFPQFISPVTSVDDAIKILKSKRIIAEAMNNMNPDAERQGYNDNYDGYSLKDCPYTGIDAALWKDGWMEAETEKQMDHDEDTYNRETGGYGDLYKESLNEDDDTRDMRVFKLKNQYTPESLIKNLLWQGTDKWKSIDDMVKFVQKIYPDMDEDKILDAINAHKKAGSPTFSFKDDDLPFFEDKKRSLKEAEDKTEGRWKEATGQGQYDRFRDLDNVNFTTFLRAVAFEVSKDPIVDDNKLPAIMDKVAKAMKKDPMAYRDLVISNTEEIKKQDETRKMRDVKPENMVDKDNGMKEVKGQEKYKADSAPKTEYRKGKPEGVKEMGITPKKAPGIKDVMDMPGKEKVLDQLKESLKKSLKEDTHYKYTPGGEVDTPAGKGIVAGITGGTITVQLDNGQEADFQINVLDAIEAKKQQAAQFDSMPNIGSVGQKWLSSQVQEGENDPKKQEFQDLVDKYDWYHEMSDDDRKHQAGLEMNKKLKALAAQIGEDEAVELFNAKAPKDRKIKSIDDLREGKKDKYSKLKEFLKKALKKEAVKFKAGGETIFTNNQEAGAKEAELKKAGVKYTKSNA
jgi:ribosome modulation factor